MRRFACALGSLALLSALIGNQALGQTIRPFVKSVGNVASYDTGSISPGEMVVIFGSGLGPSQVVTAQLDSKGKVATALSQVQVLFGGTAAPLIYVSEGQIAAMVPYGLVGKSTTQVQVVYQGTSSDPLQKGVTSSAPGIFTADSSGHGQAAVTNSDGSYNTSANPATPGSFVTLYVTGEGQTDPPGSDGNIAASTANVVLPVTALIAGHPAQLIYAGSAPGNVNGFCQINAVIPPDLQYGGDLPLVVQIGGVSSQVGVTVSVSGPAAPIPGAPQSPTATVNSSGQVVVSWTPADGLVTAFHIERQSGGAGFNEIGLLKPPTTSFTDSNVSPATTYQYRIRAENDYGFSAYSAVVNASIPAAQILPPTNLQAVAVSQIQINLLWTTPNTNALRFHIERKTGTGSYAEITTVPATATNYQDTALQANTTYTYRMRSENASGFSAYSNEASATTPALPLPPAPTLQGITISASQIHLSWISTATGTIRFRIERRLYTTTYAEIVQPSPTSTGYDDIGLSGSTHYLYRMRVETAAGLSAYSNEVVITTFPSAPTNLQATVTSSSQINLTWVNNALDALAIRVESQPASSTTFTDIGAAATSTSTAVINLQPNTTYSFRVRAQSGVGYSSYSNIATVTTLPIPKTVFLIHGIGQSSFDMQGLYGSLTGSSGIDLTRFRVDAGFDFSECAATDFCSAGCSFSSGAQKLAQYIANANPPGDIILIGYSMGGLIARDLMAYNRINLNGRKIAALITLGTPNLGYPYTLLDTTLFCTNIVQEMDGNWRSQQASNTVVLSPYLNSLTNLWPSASYPASSGSWLAASGRSCSNPLRTINTTTGCRDKNPYSDGVVCDDSATYNVSTATGTAPNQYWQDPSQIYVHSNSFWGVGTSFVLCGNSGNSAINPPLSNPPVFGPLFAAIKGLINGLH